MSAGPGRARACRCSASTSCPRRSPADPGRGASALHRDVFDAAARGGPLGDAPCSPTATSASAATRSRCSPGRAPARRRRPGGGRGRPARHGRSRTRHVAPRVREVAAPTRSRGRSGADAIRGRAAAGLRVARLARPDGALVRRPRAWRAAADARASAVPREDDFTSWLRGPAVAARVGLLAGHLLRPGVRDRADQPPRPGPRRRWLTFPTQPGLGLPGHPGRARHRGHGGRPAAAGQAAGRVYPKLFARRRARLRELAAARARAGVDRACWSRPRSSSWSTGCRTPRSGTPGRFSFRPTHYAWPGSRSGPGRAHRGQAADHPRRALPSDVDGTAERPGRTAPAPGSMSRRGLLRTAWAAAGVAVLATAGATVPWLRTVSVFGVRVRRGTAGRPDQPDRGAPRRGRGRHQRDVPTDGGARRPGGAAQPRRPPGDAADDARRCRSRASRAGAPVGDMDRRPGARPA